MSLELAQDEMELLGEAGETGGGAEDFQGRLVLQEQGAEDHDAAFLTEQLPGGDAEVVEDKGGQPLEGQNMQPGVAAEFRCGEQLAFELEGGLFRRQQQQGRACGRREQFPADFRKAAMGLAAAGGAEEELNAHGDRVEQSSGGVKEIIC